MLLRRVLVGLGLMASTARGIEVSVDEKDSVKEAAGTVAYGLMRFYTGNETGDTPGNLPDPYYWWLCGAMVGTMIDYWHFTGDDSYNDVLKQAMIHQAGPDRDFMPGNQTLTEGNDDQGFWAMAAMSAAEHVFPNPPKDQPQWLALVQAVFNEFVGRWDKKHCNGGLRWQIFNFNAGWNYKNTISNGCFFNVAARLARYTGNETYAKWAETVWDWEEELGLITDKYVVKDGAHIGEGEDCSDIDSTEYSYNPAIFMHGCAHMFKFTKDEVWKERSSGLLDHATTKFVKNNVVYEQLCEPSGGCDDDQRSFKGYLLRWLKSTIQLIPELSGKVKPLLKSSAEAAALACSGNPTQPISDHPMFDGHPGTACGFKWTDGKYDNKFGVPEQMNAVSAMIYNLDAKGPRSADNGGTSKGDPGAGGDDAEKTKIFEPITTGDKVGAGFLTTLILVGVIGGGTFLVT